MTLPSDLCEHLFDALSAAAAQDIMPAFRNIDRANVRAKLQPHDVVTDADIAAEKRIAASLKRILPDALIIGEEAVSGQPDLLQGIGRAPYTVIIDPIDGTLNFTQGLPIFATMVAIMRGTETVMSCIYDPITGDALTAEKGSGTELRFANGSSVAAAKTDISSVNSTKTSFMNAMQHPPALRAKIIQAWEGLGYVRSLHCSAIEYKMTATGIANFVFSNHAKPWDHAAGALAVSEAGGDVRFLDGTPYTPMRQKAPIVAAGSSEVCDFLCNRFAFID